MSRKAHQPSFLSELLEQGEADDVAKWSAFALASGGSDTVGLSMTVDSDLANASYRR